MCAHEVNKTANHVGVIKVIYYRTPQLREVDDLHYMMIHVLQITCWYFVFICWYLNIICTFYFNILHADILALHPDSSTSIADTWTLHAYTYSLNAVILTYFCWYLIKWWCSICSGSKLSTSSGIVMQKNSGILLVQSPTDDHCR